MAEPGIREGLALLRNPNFARGFFAYLVSYFGTAMAPIAMAFGVLELTGSTRDSAIVIAAPTIAQVVILLLSGTLADRTSRQWMLAGSDVIAMSAQFAMAFLFLSGQATVPLLAGLMLVNGAAYAINTPAATGLIPQLVERHELQAANALLAMARNSAFTIGAAAAGMMVAFMGAGMTLLIDGITFGISALLIATMRPRRQVKGESVSLWTDLKLGWREFTRHTWLWTIVVQFSLVVAALDAVWGLLGPAVAREHLGGAVAWGFVSAALGFGTILGGVAAIKLRPRRPMYFASFCVFFFAAVPFTLIFLPPIWVVCVASFLAGVTGEIFAVLWYTTLQKLVPENMLSRVSAYDHLGSIALAPLGVVAGGFLYESIGHTATLAIAAATVVVPTTAILLVRDVRHLTVPD